MQLSLRPALALIVRDEACTLEALLQWMAPHVSRIYIVDTGSSDSTIRVARKWNAHLWARPWKGFGPSKQFLLERIHEEWVWFLDADEFPDEEALALANQILSSSNAGERTPDGIVFPRIPFFGERRIRWGPTGKIDYRLRFFRTHAFQWTSIPVHEDLIPVRSDILVLRAPRGKIYHFTDESFQERLYKVWWYGIHGQQKVASPSINSTSSFLPGIRFAIRLFRNLFLKGGILSFQSLLISVMDALEPVLKYERKKPTDYFRVLGKKPR